ncbi:MAG: phytanoyl-CoA dioxygenase family protein [Gammaproteobacteria bacterium]|nr:phytanoyl-CoA dioxygenase family protein [Gammaproteobacteria bacterium]
MEGPGARSTLQPEEVDLFRHNGFVKLPTRLPADLVEGLKASALEDIQNEVEPVARRDGEVDRISGLWDRGGVFQQAIACDEILDPLESLLGPNIEFMLNRHNHIYLRDRKSLASIELHRDCRVWSRNLLSVLVYLEDTHLENGCTYVVPGSHHLPTLSNFAYIRERKELLGIAWSQAIPLPMPAGGLLAMDGLLLHAAGRNQTDGTRMSMTLGYHSADEFSLPDDRKHVLVRGERTYGGNDVRSMDRYSRPGSKRTEVY